MTDPGPIKAQSVKQVSFFLTALMLLAANSLAQDVHYNFEVDTHFEKFKTYKWPEIKDAQKVDELYHQKSKTSAGVCQETTHSIHALRGSRHGPFPSARFRDHRHIVL